MNRAVLETGGGNLSSWPTRFAEAPHPDPPPQATRKRERARHFRRYDQLDLI